MRMGRVDVALYFKIWFHLFWVGRMSLLCSHILTSVLLLKVIIVNLGNKGTTLLYGFFFVTQIRLVKSMLMWSRLWRQQFLCSIIFILKESKREVNFAYKCLSWHLLFSWGKMVFILVPLEKTFKKMKVGCVYIEGLSLRRHTVFLVISVQSCFVHL